MRKFDPWPIFFRREWNRNWPFLVGFAVTGALITKLSLGLTEEDAKNSAFVQRHKSLGGFFWGLWKARFMPSYLAYGLAVSATRISDVQWEYPFFLQNHSQKESFPQPTRGKQFPPVLGSA